MAANYEVKLYWDDVEEGQEVPEFSRETDLMHWNRYAAVNDEFLYIHMDDGAAQKANQPGVFGMGNVRWAYMHNMLTSWIGDSGFIKRLQTQYRGMNFYGDVLTAKGTVTRKYEEDGDYKLDLDVWVENQDKVNTCPSKATVSLPKR